VGDEPVAEDGGAVVTRTTSTDRTFCAAGAQQQVSVYADGWCSRVTGPLDVFAGHRVSYAYKLCRSVGSAAGTLHFDTRKEADFTVQRETDSGTVPVWHAGTTAALPAQAHTLTVAAGDCVTWSTTWSGQGDDGYALAETEAYEVDAIPWATEWVGPDPGSGPPVSFVQVQVHWQ
jgi:hypothetical protein